MTASALPALTRPLQLPKTLADSLHELPFGSHAQIQTQDGKIAAFLAYVGYDRRVGTAKYALRILNNTPQTAYARLLVETRGTLMPAYPLAFEVTPFSMRDDVIPVRMDVTGPFDRAIVEVSSDTTHFVVEAAPPPRERRAWMRWVALAVVPIALAGTAALSTPRVIALGAPAKAFAGTSIHVPYQTAGIGAVDYDFSTRDGLQIAAGLGTSDGVLTLPIPANGAGSPYVLRIHKRNVLADQQATATIVAIADRAPMKKPSAAAPQQPLIGDVSVTPSSVLAGATLTVSYASQAKTGDVYLVDQYGRTWSHAPLAAGGLSMIHVPQSAAGRDMRVVLYASSGKIHAQTSIGVSVLASDAVQQTAAAPSSAAPSFAAPSHAGETPSLTLDTHIVSAGDNIVVRVSGVHSDVRISMMTSGGVAVAQGDIPDSGSAIAIMAPSVSVASVYYIVGGFNNGNSQQTLVRRVLVTPR